MIRVSYIFVINFLFVISSFCTSNAYLWLEDYNQSNAIINRISVPDGYERIKAETGTFEHWLQYLPLKEGNPNVYLFDGRKKINQNAHFAVVDMAIGDKDLQQCADAIIRLRAEYFYSQAAYDSIYFRLTNGDVVSFRQWIEGYRPIVHGNRIGWRETSHRDSSSYNVLEDYLTFIFIYAGSFSLSKQLAKLENCDEIKIGDVFIEGGFPGHAAMIVDMAANLKDGKKIFLLAQSFMPAQDFHILKNPNDKKLSPWFAIDFRNQLRTPEWTFKKNQLMKF